MSHKSDPFKHSTKSCHCHLLLKPGNPNTMPCSNEFADHLPKALRNLARNLSRTCQDFAKNLPRICQELQATPRSKKTRTPHFRICYNYNCQTMLAQNRRWQRICERMGRTRPLANVSPRWSSGCRFTASEVFGQYSSHN